MIFLFWKQSPLGKLISEGIAECLPAKVDNECITSESEGNQQGMLDSDKTAEREAQTLASSSSLLLRECVKKTTSKALRKIVFNETYSRNP